MQNLNIKYVAHFQKTARDSGTASSLVETKTSEETERRRNKKLKKQPHAQNVLYVDHRRTWIIVTMKVVWF